MEKTIRVTLLGREYPLRVNEEHEGFTARVAEMVEQRARELERAATGHTPLTHMALTALSLGEELLALREELTGVPNLEHEVEALTNRLDAVLENGGENADTSTGARKKPAAKRAKTSRKATATPETRADKAPRASAAAVAEEPATEEGA